jgi:hypothetical protein
MASIERLEQALRRADAAGDAEAAKRFAEEIRKQKRVTPSSGILDTFNSFSDAAATMISNVGGAIAGSTYGFGKGIYNAVQEGTYGTQAGVRTVRDTMADVTDQFSKGDAYTPGGQAILDAGSEAVRAVAEPIMEFDQDAKILEPLAMMPGSPLAPASRSLAVSAGAPVVARNAARATSEAAQAAATAPVRGAQAVIQKATEPPANSRSIGAAETDKARERLATSQNTPIPFEGDAGLTRGQATRDAQQLKFEQEAARDGDVEVQDRKRNQQIVANQNFDAMEDDIGAPRFANREEQGAAVRESLQNYKTQRKKQKDDAYAVAREAGETEHLIPQMTGLNEVMQEAWVFRHGNPKNEAIWRTAHEMNMIDSDGNLKPFTIHTAEEFRKVINNNFDISNPSEARWRGKFLRVVDEALDSVPAGAKYREARAIARDYYDEFENSPLARDMDKNLRGTNVDRVADEKIAQRVMASPLKQIRQIESTLNSTPEGAATWKSIQAEFLRDIRSHAFGQQTSDLTGTPLLTAARFKKKVADLDESGKLEAILGREQAQNIRDLAEVAEYVASLPPQAVNPGTASELMRRLQAMVPSMVVNAAKSATNKAKVKKSLDGESLLIEGMR